MAFQMSFLDTDGTTYAQSYWIPAQININIVERNAHLVFLGYKDAASFQAGKTCISSHAYDLGEEDFVTYFSPSVWTNGVTPLSQTYLYATNKLDSPKPDANGSNGLSFFATATVV